MANGHPKLGTPGAPLRINQPNGVGIARYTDFIDKDFQRWSKVWAIGCVNMF